MKTKTLFFIILAFIAIGQTSGQKDNKKGSITGVVVDINQNPVHDAIITIDGKKTRNSTNENGKYKIKVKSSAEKIGIFTLPPVIIQEPINGRTVINFSLDTSITRQIAEQKNAFGEEEINIGYGTEKRKNLTTPVSKIDARKDRYAGYQTIYDMLRGEIPGVQVDGTRIRIRESASSLSSNEPLFVVDGVPVNSIDGIQPQMVRTLEVLKGPAASIYGTRGQNGVILISLSDPKKAK